MQVRIAAEKQSLMVRVGSVLPSVLSHSAVERPEQMRHEFASAFWLLVSGFPLRNPRSVHGIRQSECAFDLVELCQCACHKHHLQGEEMMADERFLERWLDLSKSSVPALVLQCWPMSWTTMILPLGPRIDVQS